MRYQLFFSKYSALNEKIVQQNTFQFFKNLCRKISCQRTRFVLKYCRTTHFFSLFYYCSEVACHKIFKSNSLFRISFGFVNQMIRKLTTFFNLALQKSFNTIIVSMAQLVSSRVHILLTVMTNLLFHFFSIPSLITILGSSTSDYWRLQSRPTLK